MPWQPQARIQTTRVTSLRTALALLLALLVSPTAAPRAQSVETAFDFGRWPYPLYEEVVKGLHELARQYPKLARTHNIGKTGDTGRDLWVLEISNAATGPTETKPGLWLDGNIHAAELTGRRLLMFFAERLLTSYGKDAEATALVDTRVFYVMPILDVDGGERVLTRHPAWPSHNPQEQVGRDLDGDGYITLMRLKDPAGEWYASARDPRVLLKMRDRSRGHWRYLPATAEMPESFEEDLAPLGKRYRVFVEGDGAEPAGAVDYLYFGLDPRGSEREPANFNRNWSAEWKPGQRGAGPYPFALPEVRAVAAFITSHRNIFFHYTIHSGGINKNYIVRPPMTHPYQDIPPEDNEFYTRVAAVWGAVSGGDLLFNDYYSQEARPGTYGQPDTGFSNDWAYFHLGIFSLLPETGGAGDRDYDGDGYLSPYEVLRWNDEQKGGQYFVPWRPYRHSTLGDVEIGGPRGMPQGIDARLRRECEKHYRLLTRIANMSPLLRLKDLTSERLDDGTFAVRAVVQNTGFLSTYVTRHALDVKKDDPIVASIAVKGGQLVGDDASKTLGHILGRLAYIRRWGFGANESTRVVEWKVRPGPGTTTVEVEVQASKAGADRRTLELANGTAAPSR